MVLLIYPPCIINVGVSLLSFSCCVSIFPCCICNSMYFYFIYTSFSDGVRSSILCFLGTTLACLMDTSCLRLGSRYTLSLLNPKDLYTSCILIGINHPSKKLFPPIHKAKVPLKNYSCVPDTAIDGPGTSIKYTECPKIVDALGLMKIYTMDQLVLPQALSTVGANNVSKLSMINASGGVSFQNFSLMCPGSFLVMASSLALPLLLYLGALSLSMVLGSMF